MVRRRKKPNNRLMPRSFLAGPKLDRALREISEREGMTISQWVRKVLEERLVFEGYNRATLRPTRKMEEAQP